MFIKRIFLVKCIFLIFIIILLGRLFYIQIIGHEEFSHKAAIQQTISITGIRDKPYIYIFKNASKMQNEKAANDNMESIRFDMMRLYGKLLQNTNNSNYLIYVSDRYNEEMAKVLLDKYGVYIIENNEGWVNKIYVYADARGNILNGMSIMKKRNFKKDYE